MRQYLINKLLSNLVRVITPQDIIRVDKKGVVYLGGKELTIDEKKSLQAESKALVQMRIWSIINESVKQLCYERGWRDSENIEHLNIAKAMFSVLDTQTSILAKINMI